MRGLFQTQHLNRVIQDQDGLKSARQWYERGHRYMTRVLLGVPKWVRRSTCVNAWAALFATYDRMPGGAVVVSYGIQKVSLHSLWAHMERGISILSHTHDHGQKMSGRSSPTYGACFVETWAHPSCNDKKYVGEELRATDGSVKQPNDA
jgi:hypothetical protein